MPDATYVIRREGVRVATQALLSRDSHPFFIAYLWLRRQAVIQGTTAHIRPDWAGLAPYMEVSGALPSKPYLRPFWQGRHDSGQEWLNNNIAGSFAPSSLRKVALQVLSLIHI